MSWVVDGNNLLGRAGAARDAADSKRQLIRSLANFARARRTKVACYFDGTEPEHFGRHLGGVSVIFSGARSADDLIANKVATGSGWKVVTADRGLAARIQRRQVEVINPAAFMTELETLPAGEETIAGEEWLTWFSDPKNRNIF
ncbi:MAG: NYN domain-containing protein [Thermoanaerobaculia bacterium]